MSQPTVRCLDALPSLVDSSGEVAADVLVRKQNQLDDVQALMADGMSRADAVALASAVATDRVLAARVTDLEKQRAKTLQTNSGLVKVALGTTNVATGGNIVPFRTPSGQFAYRIVRRVVPPRRTDTTVRIPSTLDYRPALGAIRDQGDQGACVGFASACIKEYQESVDNARFSGYMSPQFIYNLRSNAPSEGMTADNAFTILKTVGIVPEASYPYEASYISPRGNSGLMTAAANFRIRSYTFLSRLNDIKTALYLFGPLMITVPVYNTGTRMWHRPSSRSPLLGGHAMAVVGYTSTAFIIRNSWGLSWGNAGYTTFPFSDLGRQWDLVSSVDMTGSLPAAVQAGIVQPN